MDDAFHEAVARQSAAYLYAERTLRDGGDAAVETLTRGRTHSDPFTRALAETLLAWVDGRTPAAGPALDYLDGLPSRTERSRLIAPRTQAVAARLATRWGGSAANVLALRLVKQHEWPRWRARAVLIYLLGQRNRSTTVFLLRFAVETPEEELRAGAVDAIRAIEDPGLRVLLAWERRRLGPGKSLPPAVEALAERDE